MATLDLVAPVPLTAVLTLGVPPVDAALVITFDLPLVVGLLDERTYTLRASSFEWDAAMAAVLAPRPTEVAIDFDRTDPAAPGDVISYNALPADLVGQNGLPVAPFVDFPVTVV